jgi:hypothetical protein
MTNKEIRTMKKIEFIDQEIKILKEVVTLAIANGNRSTPLAYDPSPAEYSILCDICNKLYKEITQ